MPASCIGKTYCFDKGDKYPEGKIAELLSDMHGLVRKNIIVIIHDAIYVVLQRQPT